MVASGERQSNENNPPLWQAHDAPNYNEIMTERCRDVLARIETDPAYRANVRNDPRGLHNYLFQQFTPNGYEEYAGTYRGTPNTSLFERVASANSVVVDGEHYSFCAPNEVSGRMIAWGNAVAGFVLEANTADQRLTALAFQFARLGRIHPFLDGNGHVQRVLFAALARELGYNTNNRFAIHPRPYDRLFAIALEFFSRAPEASANEQLGIVREYLSFYIS
jgi:fido (protein-threonine AMPylation protein)